MQPGGTILLARRRQRWFRGGMTVNDEPTRRRVTTAALDLQNQPEIAARVSRRQNFGKWCAGSPLAEIVFDDEQEQR